MRRFERYADTLYIDANMCMFDMVTDVEGEHGLVSKATIFMTKSYEVASRLYRQCTAEHREKFKHLPIFGERARLAQIYPPALCQAVTAVIKAQKLVDETPLCSMDLLDLGIAEDDLCQPDLYHDLDDFEWMQAWDDVTSKEL